MTLADNGRPLDNSTVCGSTFWRCVLDDLVTLGLAAATLGQAALCTSILLPRSFEKHVYLPLLLFFTASGIIAMGPAVAKLAPAWGPTFIAIGLPALLLLGPSLWLYAEGLTSERAWRLQARHKWHFIPVLLGAIVAVLIAVLPNDVRFKLFMEGQYVEGLLSTSVVVLFFLLIMWWLPQSTYYLFRIYRQLSSYRVRLKNLFASNEGRELSWLAWLVLIIGGVWIMGFASVISDNFFNFRFVNGAYWAVAWFLMVWSLAVWGLRQRPGFEGRYLESDSELEVIEETSAPNVQKYQRSALGADQAERIAGKIERAMTIDRLYLDSNLTLQKLSKHLGASPNFVSQTLNETIGESFFDFVNRWRIEAAKPKIISEDATVLAIALSVGFNARSSFYKAFKRETGQTPRSYKISNGRGEFS